MASDYYGLGNPELFGVCQDNRPAYGDPMRNKMFIPLVVVLTAAIWPASLSANYIDPTTGGVLLQVIFGGFAGAAVVWKIFRHKMASVFAPRRLMRRILRSPLGSVGPTDVESSDNGEA